MISRQFGFAMAAFASASALTLACAHSDDSRAKAPYDETQVTGARVRTEATPAAPAYERAQSVPSATPTAAPLDDRVLITPGAGNAGSTGDTTSPGGTYGSGTGGPTGSPDNASRKGTFVTPDASVLETPRSR